MNLVITQILTPVVTPIIIAAIKGITLKVPKWSLPLLAGLIGGLIDTLGALATNDQFSPIHGAFLGLAGVGLREALDQLKKTDFKVLSVLAIAALSILSFTGCAYYNPRLMTETETRQTNGVVVVQRQSLRAPAIATWPAATDIAKQKISVGKTLSLGVDGLREDGGGTNLVEGLKQLNSLVEKFHP
jgi:hypothetical protein